MLTQDYGQLGCKQNRALFLMKRFHTYTLPCYSVHSKVRQTVAHLNTGTSLSETTFLYSEGVEIPVISLVLQPC